MKQGDDVIIKHSGDLGRVWEVEDGEENMKVKVYPDGRSEPYYTWLPEEHLELDK